MGVGSEVKDTITPHTHPRILFDMFIVNSFLFRNLRYHLQGYRLVILYIKNLEICKENMINNILITAIVDKGKL